MNQLELSIEKSGFSPEEGEILIALLLDKGFESFEEEDSFIRAFCPENQLASTIPQIMESVWESLGKKPDYSYRSIPDKNWNEQWEKGFSPIIIDDRILVKAPFHQIPDKEYTIIIEPKMSFGTGHHETTRLMLREMLQIDFTEKEVLDMGCGTGVLGIAAKMMGASYLLAVDIDNWAYYNSVENFYKNKIHQPYDIIPGDVSLIEGHTFHFILANINRNILLNDFPFYFNALKDDGMLIVSGILTSDKDAIIARAEEFGYRCVKSFYENNWISLNLRK